jgi:amino acid transporter
MSSSQPDAPPDASQAAQAARAEDASRRSERKASMWAIGLTSLFAVGIIASIPLALWLVKVAGVSSKTSPVEINLAIVLIAAATALILIIGSLTIVFRRLRLQDRKEAMGLPSGSIRAIIALLLIVLFFISAIYLYSTVQQSEVRGPARTLTGITAAQLAACRRTRSTGSSRARRKRSRSMTSPWPGGWNATGAPTTWPPSSSRPSPPWWCRLRRSTSVRTPSPARPRSG